MFILSGDHYSFESGSLRVPSQDVGKVFLFWRGGLARKHPFLGARHSGSPNLQLRGRQPGWAFWVHNAGGVVETCSLRCVHVGGHGGKTQPVERVGGCPSAHGNRPGPRACAHITGCWEVSNGHSLALGAQHHGPSPDTMAPGSWTSCSMEDPGILLWPRMGTRQGVQPLPTAGVSAFVSRCV